MNGFCIFFLFGEEGFAYRHMLSFLSDFLYFLSFLGS